MKFTIKQPDLTKALSTVGKIVTGKNTLPVLDNVLIEVKEENLQFTTTSLEVSISIIIPAIVNEPGSITLPVRLLQNFTALTGSDEDIEIEVDNNQTAHIKLQNSKNQIKGINAEEFPKMPTIKKEKILILSPKDFVESVGKVAFATSAEQIRPVLTGVYFKSEEGKLIMAGTDSYRLAENKIEINQKSDDFDVIIPARFTTEAARILSEEKEDIEIILSRHQIVFKSSTVNFITRNIEGRFPPYAQIIPKECKSSIELDVADTTREVKKAALFTTNGQINLKFEDNGLRVESVSQEGSGDIVLQGDVQGEKESEIRINSGYLLDILSHIKGKTVRIGVNAQRMPAFIQSASDEDYSYVIMPVNQ